MRIGQTLLPGLLALLLVAGAAATSCGRAPAHCSQCGRVECRNLSFSIRLADGSTVETCCPRCGLRYLDEERPAVVTLAVRDFETARPVEARGALYVEGSDAHPCGHSTSGPPVDDRGCCLKPVYDRCEPSLVAFGSRARAEAFAAAHGGFVRTFDALVAASR